MSSPDRSRSYALSLGLLGFGLTAVDGLTDRDIRMQARSARSVCTLFYVKLVIHALKGNFNQEVEELFLICIV